MDLLTQVFREEDGEIVEYPGIRVSISSLQRHEGSTIRLPRVSYQLKLAVHKPLSILVNGEPVLVQPDREVEIRSEMNGFLEIDIPVTKSLVTPILFIRASFMPKKKWRMFYLKDMIRRIVKMKGRLEHVLPGVSKEGLQALEMADEQILSVALEGMPAVTNKRRLQKRGLVSGSIDATVQKDGLVHEDDHAESTFLLKKSSEHSDVHDLWMLDLSDMKQPRYQKFESKENMDDQLKALEPRLVKRGLLLDLSDKIHFGSKEVTNNIKDGVVEFVHGVDQFFVERSKGDGPLSLIIRMVHKATKKVVKWVINTVQAAVKFIQMLMNKVGVVIRKLADKLKAFFSLNDIYTTSRFLATHMKKMVYAIPLVIDQRTKEFEEKADNLKLEINKKMDAAIKRWGGEKSIGSWVEEERNRHRGVIEENTDSRSRYIQHRIAKTLDPESPKNRGKDQTRIHEERKILNDEITNRFVSDLDSAIPPEKRDVFQKQVGTQVGETFGNGIIGLTMAKLFTFLKKVINVAIDSVVKIREVAMDVIKKVIIS